MDGQYQRLGIDTQQIEAPGLTLACRIPVAQGCYFEQGYQPGAAPTSGKS
jgi:hypothetical protein